MASDMIRAPSRTSSHLSSSILVEFYQQQRHDKPPQGLSMFSESHPLVTMMLLVRRLPRTVRAHGISTSSPPSPSPQQCPGYISLLFPSYFAFGHLAFCNDTEKLSMAPALRMTRSKQRVETIFLQFFQAQEFDTSDRPLRSPGVLQISLFGKVATQVYRERCTADSVFCQSLDDSPIT